MCAEEQHIMGNTKMIFLYEENDPAAKQAAEFLRDEFKVRIGTPDEKHDGMVVGLFGTDWKAVQGSTPVRRIRPDCVSLKMGMPDWARTLKVRFALRKDISNQKPFEHSNLKRQLRVEFCQLVSTTKSERRAPDPVARESTGRRHGKKHRQRELADSHH